jgi:hypothetical protein
LKRDNPEMYEEEKKENYVANADIDSPAVISVNMRAAADAFNEFMDRVHHLRTYSETVKNAIVKSSVLQTTSYNKCDKSEGDNLLKPYIGRGDLNPLLERSCFSQPQIIEA